MLGIGDYLSGMRHHKETLLTRFDDFWRAIYDKANESRAYKDHIVVTEGPEYSISLDGTGLSLSVSKRIVFLEKSPVLEIDFHQCVKDEKRSVLKIYINTEGSLFLGHPVDVEPLNFFYEETDTPFFEALIRSASAGNYISVDR